MIVIATSMLGIFFGGCVIVKYMIDRYEGNDPSLKSLAIGLGAVVLCGCTLFINIV